MIYRNAVGFFLLFFSCMVTLSVSSGRTKDGNTEQQQLPFPEILCNMSFYDVSVKSLLKSFAEEHNFNIIVAHDINKKISINLQNVTLEEAFRAILSVSDLDYIINGKIIEVDTSQKINSKIEIYNKKLESLKRKQDLSIDLTELETRIFPLKYSMNPRPTIARDVPKGGNELRSLDQLAEMIEKETLSKRGKIAVIEDRNAIVITDIPEVLDRVSDIIKKIDVQPLQISIEARIVDITDNYVKEIGIQWGGSYKRGDFQTTGGQKTDVEEGGAVENTGPAMQGVGLSGDNYVLNMPAAVGLLKGASVGFLLSDGEKFNLDMQLSALEEDKKLKVISKPRVITLDNQRAYIESGQEIPYKDYESEVTGGFSIEFKKAALQLEVTPHMLDNGTRMYLNIVVAEKSANYSQAVFLDGEPPIDTRSLTTKVIVNNNETVVIGGLKRETVQETDEGVPILSDIPLLGKLFSFKGNDEQKSQLMIFITPQVIENSMVTPDV